MTRRRSHSAINSAHSLDTTTMALPWGANRATTRRSYPWRRIDPAGGFVEEEEVAISGQPAGHDDLLLVAPAQLVHPLFVGGAAHPQPAAKAIGGFVLRLAVEPTNPMACRGRVERVVLTRTDGRAKDRPAFDPRVPCPSRGEPHRPDDGCVPVSSSRISLRLLPVRAEDRAQGFRSTRANQAGQPRISPHRVETHVADAVARVKIPDPQGNAPARRRRRSSLREVVTGHFADQFGGSPLRPWVATCRPSRRR